MANFAANGVACLGTDVIQSIVDTINEGRIPIPNLEYWLGFPVEPLVKSGMMQATVNWRDLIKEEIAVHMIAVPIEKDDKPWDDALIDVTKKIRPAVRSVNSVLFICIVTWKVRWITSWKT